MAKTYQVTDENGVLVGGKRYKKGVNLPSTLTTTAQIRAFKRFNQVKEVEIEEATESDEDRAPSTVPELKAALEALNVEIPEGSLKADLEKLYEEATESDE